MFVVMRGDTTYRQRYTISETVQEWAGVTAILRRYRYAMHIIGLVVQGLPFMPRRERLKRYMGQNVNY